MLVLQKKSTSPDPENVPNNVTGDSGPKAKSVDLGDTTPGSQELREAFETTKWLPPAMSFLNNSDS